jgi:hypothetical protein
MEDLVITYHHDPAHGWLEVKRELVEMLGIQGLISSYSYQKGDRLFLEEDADASLLIRSLGELGIKYTLIDRHTNADHWIRVLDRYNALV